MAEKTVEELINEERALAEAESAPPMAAPTAPRDSRAIAGLDHELIAGLGADPEDDRTHVNYPTFLELAKRNARMSRYAVLFLARPNRAGERATVALPAEKFQKWYGMGYEPVGYFKPEKRSPSMWTQSMIEDAISEGRPIPDDMKPPGYAGRVFHIENPVVEAE